MTRRKSVQVDFGKGFLGTTDAAAALGLSVTSIQKMVSAGVLKAFRTSGGHRRISIESIGSVAEQMGVPWKDRILAAPAMVAAAAVAAATGGDGAGVVTSGKGVEIVLVDDGSATLHPIANLINRRNSDVRCVVFSDSVEALVWTNEKQPDLVVTELTVKPLDGFSLIKAVRGSPRLRQVGVIVVTSLSTEEIARRGGVPDGVVVYHQPLPCERVAGFLDAILHLRDRLSA